jgi:hypothetical protein
MQKLVVKGSRLSLYQCRTVIITYYIALYILLFLNTYSILCIVTTVALPDSIVIVGCTVGVPVMHMHGLLEGICIFAFRSISHCLHNQLVRSV